MPVVLQCIVDEPVLVFVLSTEHLVQRDLDPQFLEEHQRPEQPLLVLDLFHIKQTAYLEVL